MARRKSETYRKDVAIPRDPGDDLVRTTVWVDVDEAEWIRSRGRKSDVLRGILRRTRLENGLRRIAIAELGPATVRIFARIPKMDVTWANGLGGLSPVVRTLIARFRTD